MDIDWTSRPHIMGVVNVTPDSFSGDGTIKQGAQAMKATVERAIVAVGEGADILDVGGIASFPGAPFVDAGEEARRVIPAVRAIRGVVSVPLSIDTYRAEIAAHAVEAGATIINCYWGLRFPDGRWNRDIVRLAADAGASIVIAHNRRATVRTSGFGTHYTGTQQKDIVDRVARDLATELEFADRHGIDRKAIILDPGIGQGKTPEENVLLLGNLRRLQQFRLPLMIAASRKSFIGRILNVPPAERDAGSAAVTALAVEQGVSIIRVHNVQVNAHAAAVANAIYRARADHSLRFDPADRPPG